MSHDFDTWIQSQPGAEDDEDFILIARAIWNAATFVARNKEIPAAFTAGFICAGGDCDEAQEQGRMFLECCKTVTRVEL